MEKQMIEISTKTILKVILILLAFLFLYFIRDILVILIFAIVIASGVENPVRLLQKYKVPRILGVVFVYLAAFASLFIFLYLVAPPLISEFRQVSSLFVEYEEIIGDLFKSFGLPINIPDMTQNAIGEISQTTSSVLSFITKLLGGVFSAVSIIVISFYLSIQEKGFERFLRIVIPKEHEEYIIDLWERAQRKIGRWIQGQLVLAALVGLMSFVALYFLGVKYALIFAVFAGLVEVVPIIGPIIATIPVVIFVSLQDPILGLVVLGVYAAIQQLENHIFVPLVMKKTVGLNPVIVILAILIGAKLGGIAGMILAIPLSAAGMEFLRDVMARRKEKLEA